MSTILLSKLNIGTHKHYNGDGTMQSRRYWLYLLLSTG